MSLYGVTDAYNYCTEHKCNKLTSMVRKYFSGPCMKLIPMSFIHDRRFDVRFKNGEDTLYMYLISDKIRQISCTSKNAIYYRRIRGSSANTRRRTFSNRLKNSLNLIKEYSRIYISSPMNYNFRLYVANVLGALKTCIVG